MDKRFLRNALFYSIRLANKLHDILGQMTELCDLQMILSAMKRSEYPSMLVHVHFIRPEYMQGTVTVIIQLYICIRHRILNDYCFFNVPSGIYIGHDQNGVVFGLIICIFVYYVIQIYCVLLGLFLSYIDLQSPTYEFVRKGHILKTRNYLTSFLENIDSRL